MEHDLENITEFEELTDITLSEDSFRKPKIEPIEITIEESETPSIEELQDLPPRRSSATACKQTGFVKPQPYWNDTCRDSIDQLLLSNVSLARLATASLYLNDVPIKGIGTSHFSVKSIEIPELKKSPLWRNIISYLPITQGSEVAMSASRFPLRPTTEQKLKFRTWFTCYRHTFNAIIQYKSDEFDAFGRSNSYLSGTKEWTNRLYQEYKWIFESGTPSDVIYGAMRDADFAYTSHIRLLVKYKGTGKSVGKPFIKKNTHRSICIPGRAIREAGIFPRILGPIHSPVLIPVRPCDSRLLVEDGRWYLVIPEANPVPEARIHAKVCAIDPGVRTAFSVFGSDGLHKLGQGDFGRIVRHCQYLDELLSRQACAANSRQRRSMERAANRARHRLKRIIDDFHYQAIGWILRRYDLIIIPEADFTSACCKSGRRIGRDTVRNLMTYAFARFRDRLVSKCMREGKKCLVINEAYTSKTANWTGEIVHTLGGSKVITSQGITMDRDINGALGILLKGILKALAERPLVATPVQSQASSQHP